jgi:RHS repeat-associated protein
MTRRNEDITDMTSLGLRRCCSVTRNTWVSNAMARMCRYLHALSPLGRLVCNGGAFLGLISFVSAGYAAPFLPIGDADPATIVDRGAVTVTGAAKARVLSAMSKLPMHFEPNTGLHDAAVQYSTRGHGYHLFLNGNETVLTLRKSKGASADSGGPDNAVANRLKQGNAPAENANQEPPSVLRIRFDGANANPSAVGERPLGGKSHYFIGNDPAKWHRNVTHYAQVRYRNVYPGIDMVYYGHEGELEYDWIVAPGADPNRIVERFDGATNLRLDANGNLIVDTPAGQIWQQKPTLYQEQAGKRIPVEGSFVLLGSNTAGFKVGQYDKTRTLTIDPILQYSTVINGNIKDAAIAVAVNASGEAYILGSTVSTRFPTQDTVGTAGDENQAAFLIKLNASGDAIVFSSLFGADIQQGPFTYPVGLSIGADGSAYLAGNLNGVGLFPQTRFPETMHIGDTNPPGNPGTTGIFALKVSSDGSNLIHSTVIQLFQGPGGGSTGGIGVSGFAVDASGSAYLAGRINATNLPTTPGAYQTGNPNGAYISYVLKLTPDGNSVAYATYFGDPNPISFETTTISSLALDSVGGVYFAGATTSARLPLVNPFQSTLNSPGGNGFFGKLDSSGSFLNYSSYLGGSGIDSNFGRQDLFNAIAVDSLGNAYLTGHAISSDFPLINALPTGAFGQLNPSSPPSSPKFTAVVVKVNPAGGVVFSTPLGTESDGRAITLDRFGNIWVTGVSDAVAPFPLVNDDGLSIAGGTLFVTKFASDLQSVLFSMRAGEVTGSGGTILTGQMIGNGIATDSVGGVYVVGVARGVAAYGTGPGLRDGAFALKLIDAASSILLYSSPNPARTGSPVTLTAIVTGAGATGTVTFSDGAIVLGAVPINASGVAKLTVPTLAVATHSITANYSGDATHVPASVTVTLVVNPAPKNTVTTLSTAATIVGATLPVVLSATVTGTGGVTPTGTVVFFDGTRAVRSSTLNLAGVATTSWTIPTTGLHSVTARYDGDLLNNPSVSVALSISAVGAPTVRISAPTTNTAYDYPATIGISALAAAQAGATLTKVELLLNGVPHVVLTPPYTFSWANAPPGTYTLTAKAVDSLGQVTESAPVQVIIATPGTTFYHHDLLGNVVATTDSLGQSVYTESYQPYGGRLVNNAASPVAQPDGNRLWFHGKAQDESTGLQYFGARYYDPAIGRFMGVDSVGFNDGNIHSFNRYAYGNNNPYRYTDPDGRNPVLVAEITFEVTFIVATRLGAAIAGAWLADKLWNVLHSEENSNEQGDDGQEGNEQEGAEVEAGKGTKTRNAPPDPLPEAEGRPHSIVERPGKDGQYTTHNGDGTWKQYRGSGQDHGGVPRPNVKEAGANRAPSGQRFIDRGRVREARPDEIPGNRHEQ